jgi:DNA replication protein DnaC
MLMQPLMEQLSRLRLPAFREGLREQLGNPAVYAPLPFEERLTLLVEQECLRRESRRMKRLVHAARFPLQAEVEDLDLSVSRGLDRKLVLELAQGRWIEQHTNLFLLGPTGCGKTYLACALGRKACHSGMAVRYERTSRLLEEMRIAREQGEWISRLRELARVPLLILDDWMRDPITPLQTQNLLEVFDDRFGHASTMIATQVPVTDWHLRIPDSTLADAILDRLVHNAIRITLEGESQRKLRGSRNLSGS